MIKLPPNQHLAAPGKWPVVGEKSPRQSAAPWTLSVEGLVANPYVWTLDALLDLPQVERAVDIHCVTRWSKLGAHFGGVELRTLIQFCRPLPDARFLSFVARSDRNHSTSLPLSEVLELGAIVALTVDGAPLAEEHGGPIRVVVPDRYFYKSVKWVERIEALSEERLGYWEAESGYHNRADPWREERYMAPNLDRRTLREALESRDFSGRDLRSMDARGRDLTGLNARSAVLRDANFQGVNLAFARFDGANLSNGHFEGANLRDASFAGADVEGADFRGADLRGVDFRGASLFGATFRPSGEPDNLEPAIIDSSTRVDLESLEALAPIQRDYVRQNLDKQHD